EPTPLPVKQQEARFNARLRISGINGSEFPEPTPLPVKQQEARFNAGSSTPGTARKRHRSSLKAGKDCTCIHHTSGLILSASLAPGPRCVLPCPLSSSRSTKQCPHIP